MVLGDSLKKSFSGRPSGGAVIFGAGLLSGIAATVAIGVLRPTMRAMWSQTPPTVAVESNSDGGADESAALPAAASTVDLAPYFTDTEAVRLTRERLEQEALADANFARAKELAVQGIATRDAGRADEEETLAELQQQAYLWQAALRQLEQIPESSSLAEVAAAKREDYRAILGPVQTDINELKSAFLAEIADETGRPHAIRITICHITGACFDYKGDQPPASPASLIKLPVAVVLMKKVVEEGIDIGDPMYIDSHNWTENANGAKIYIKHTYPIREVMVRMIKESNNIATNQLLDYLGWQYMDQALQEMGYEQTKIRTKLIGDRTAPTRNRAVGRNVMTSNEVTEMMRQIYTFDGPGSDEILDALVGQYDWEFGYTAVSKLRNKRVAWIGEKTGQNSKVIGSSTAVKIDDERYVMTVTIDNSGNQKMLRQVIGDVIQHVLDEGHLVPVTRARG
ncbi:MAG: serine hydrolase [Cyanobacteria bacterium P01_F01_bin.56]